MRTQLSTALLVCLVVGGTAAGFEEPKAPPTPKSVDAQQAKARYEQAVAAARKRYLADLDEATRKATQAGDLDDAVLIRKLRMTVEGGGKPTAPRLNIKVISAMYGADGRMVDVSKVVQWNLDNGIAVQPIGGLLKIGDPAPGVAKALKLELQIAEKRMSITLPDGPTPAVTLK